MNQFFLGTNLVAVIVVAAVTLLLVAGFIRQTGKSAASNAARGQDSYTTVQSNKYKNLRLVMTFPHRISNLLALSRDQQARLQAISTRFEDPLTSAEQEKIRAFTALEKAVMNAAGEGVVTQRQRELVAANAKRLQVDAELLVEWRKVFTTEQVTRIRHELPIERNDLQLIVQLPEGFSEIGLSPDQQSQLQTVIRNEQKMITLSQKEKAGRAALEQAVFTEQFDQAAVNQRRDELIAAVSERLRVNTGILFDARKILTRDQLKRLDEITPDQ
jgi:Spy/CpxP family protein refolding chaperone